MVSLILVLTRMLSVYFRVHLSPTTGCLHLSDATWNVPVNDERHRCPNTFPNFNEAPDISKKQPDILLPLKCEIR